VNLGLVGNAIDIEIGLSTTIDKLRCFLLPLQLSTGPSKLFEFGGNQIENLVINTLKRELGDKVSRW
jgi:hypothetical protein